MLDPDWLDALVRRLDEPPARSRRPLRVRVDGRTSTIGTIEPAVVRALAERGVPIRLDGGVAAEEGAGAGAGAGDGNGAGVPAAAGIIDCAAGTDRVFAILACALRDARLAGAWRDELLAVEDESGGPVGAIERAAVRPLGIATHAVHLIARRPDGRVWVQQRAATKSTDPGCWDTTMGGLIAASEPLAAALERETWEEAGLRTGAMRELRAFGRFTVRRPVAHGYMIERTELYEAEVDADVVPVNQDGEVDRFECLDSGELLDRLQAGAFTLEAALALATWLQRPYIKPP